MHNPLEQFKILNIRTFELFGQSIEFTNSAMFMLIAWLVIALFSIVISLRATVIPDNTQVVGEMLYHMVYEMLNGTVGANGKKYMPFIFSIFIFILTLNLLGLMPYSFTVTSHFSVTISIAMIVFFVVTIIGFARHGVHYLSLFLPSGTPMIMAPLMIFIELFAYLVRPISLSLRLAANMTAGHVVLKVLASFIMMSGIFGVLPFALLTVINGFEIFIAILQAYIFAILTCVYLNDAVNLH